jgi:hypothetical protein
MQMKLSITIVTSALVEVTVIFRVYKRRLNIPRRRTFKQWNVPTGIKKSFGKTSHFVQISLVSTHCSVFSRVRPCLIVLC